MGSSDCVWPYFDLARTFFDLICCPNKDRSDTDYVAICGLGLCVNEHLTKQSSVFSLTSEQIQVSWALGPFKNVIARGLT